MIFSPQALGLFLNALLVLGAKGTSAAPAPASPQGKRTISHHPPHLHLSPHPFLEGLEAPKLDLHGLEYVYSQDHLSLYDLEYISPVEKGAHLKRRQLQETTTEERSLHIACCEYQTATEYEKFLKLQLGANNIYPAFVGESSGTVCFALFTTPSAASAVQEIPSTR